MTAFKIPNEIRREIQLVIDDIKEKTCWKPLRNLEASKIELGDTSEFYDSFGVNRFNTKIIFGNWINKIKPDYSRENIWEAVIIREAFSYFINENLLFNNLKELTNLFLNILIISYLLKKYSDKTKYLKISSIRYRFRAEPDGLHEKEKILFLKISSLLDEIINQGITYKLILETYLHLVEDYSEEDFDIEELIDDFSRFISSSPEEIAAPLNFRKRMTEILRELIFGGYKTSALKIAENLEINQSTVSRQINKIVSRFYAKWRPMKNWKKLGLYPHIVIIRFKKTDNKKINSISKELLKIRYIHQIYEGVNWDYFYLYSIVNCPLIVINSIENKLINLAKNNQILSFDIKSILSRLDRTAISSKSIKPTLKNFEALIENKIPIEKIAIWKSSWFHEDDLENLDKSDENILRFLSVLKSNSITSYSVIGCWVPEAKKMLKDNGYDLKNVHDCMNFFNKLQNTAMQRNILSYRLMISLNTSSSNYLIIVIKTDPENKKVKKLVSDLSCFASITFFTSNNELIISLIGPEFNDSLSNIIQNRIKQDYNEFEIFSTNLKNWRFVPYHELYDFESKKWLIK